MGQQDNSNRIPKTISRQLSDLEDHLYFLDADLKNITKDTSHYKRVATELRLLICKMGRSKPLLLDLIKFFDKVENYYLTSTDEFTKEITKTNILNYPNRKAFFLQRRRHL